jgi:hypothetical protein
VAVEVRWLRGNGGTFDWSRVQPRGWHVVAAEWHEGNGWEDGAEETSGSGDAPCTTRSTNTYVRRLLLPITNPRHVPAVLLWRRRPTEGSM